MILRLFQKKKADDSDERKNELQEQRKKWKDDDFLCRGYILNALLDSVYSTRRTIGTAKKLWLALDNKYRIEEASNQKFLIGNYFDFKMTDSKSVLAQVHELQLIVSNLKNAEIVLPEAFQVRAIIAKLPSSWNGYKKKLKHDETKHTLESLMRHLRIEKDSRKRENNDQAAEKANMVQGNHMGNKKRKNSSSKAKNEKTKKDQVNVTDGNHNPNLVAVVEEANSVGVEVGWGLDIGATIHVSQRQISVQDLQRMHRWKRSKNG
ncbi:uncharacterized protein LOC111406487 [Olea europaea var. sylvestris]|uniref:uncharacterized protein LOC111406487 n=1 Tax=Olea europaea var. sylvestris TaxID=158386 RepID=UPI000C1D0288|nr:uncharacterized protein LOC111406487 [Olea europaea var. sylvestris]